MNLNNLPLLPGYTKYIHHYPKFNHHLGHYFNVKNGHIISKDEHATSSALYNFVTYQKPEISRYQQLLAQERRKRTNITTFEPHYVTYDRKCLSFRAYFKFPTSDFYGKEQYIIRKVNIIYYLEDNSMTVLEPAMTNSGYTQGRLVKRGLLPKPGSNSVTFWHWKDLNIGSDADIYGVIYHIYKCDAFTKEFLTSQGIEVNDPEQIPEEDDNNKLKNKYDYLSTRNEMSSSLNEDKLQRFLRYDKKVLRFFAIWDGTNEECGDLRYYKIHYHLIDNTVEIFETDENQQKKPYPFNRFLARVRLPKVHKFDAVKTEYYEPRDFNIGDTVSVFNRKFFIYDCDVFTRRYFQDCVKKEQPESICIIKPPPVQTEKVIPPHPGIGQPEDTLQTCLSIIPKPPKKDIIHYIENANKEAITCVE